MRHSSRFSKIKILFFLFFAIALLPLGRFALFAFSASKPGARSTLLVLVQKGQSPNEITKTLTSQGIVSDPQSFLWLGRLTRQWRSIKAGEYEISSSMTPIEIFSILTSGISASHPVTVREGENMYEVADDLESKHLATREHFLSLCRDPHFIASLGFFQKEQLPVSLEGYLFPDTYFFNRTQTDSEMTRQMVRRFFTAWGKREEARATELKMSRNEVITLASMIEKETGAPEERPLISSVFHNRLQKRMKLQSDPTTIYGMWERYEGKIHKRDLMEKNNYNTYYVSALPIGPIGNPGKESIQAALYPSTSSFLYFVSHNDGTHEFTKNFEDHNRAVRKFQLDPKAREGKSWRDRLRKPGGAAVPSAQPQH